MKKAVSRTAVALATVAATAITPGVAFANEADVIRAGNCSRAADWKLKLSPENGRIEMEFQVDANARGQRWRVAVWHGGRRIERDVFRTHGRSGSFTVRRVLNNTAGADNARARAIRFGGGQTCRGRAAF